MTTTSDITIQLGLPEQHRRRAADIFFDAFTQKTVPVLGPRERAVPVIENALGTDCALIALCQGEIVGLAGIQPEGRRLMEWKWPFFKQHYGLLSGALRYVAMRIADYRPKRKGQLLMEGIAVDASMRGKGVGTLLLQAVFEFARSHDYHSVRLDVVDTNPAARRLYERIGFRAVKTRKYPYLRRLMGFSAATEMARAV